MFDSADAAAAARARLIAFGTEPVRIETLAGPEAAAAFDSTGRRHGWRGRLFRILEFSWADQASDFARYEAAVRDGKVVLGIRVRGDAAVRSVAAIVADQHGHFVNHFGWFETREVARWRSPEPDLPGILHLGDRRGELSILESETHTSRRRYARVSQRAGMSPDRSRLILVRKEKTS